MIIVFGTLPYKKMTMVQENLRKDYQRNEQT